METNNIKDIFGDINFDSRDTVMNENKFLTQEWEKLQIDIPEISDITLDKSHFPTERETQEIKMKINSGGKHNSGIQTLGIVLSIICFISISLTIESNKYFAPEIEEMNRSHVEREHIEVDKIKPIRATPELITSPASSLPLSPLTYAHSNKASIQSLQRIMIKQLQKPETEPVAFSHYIHDYNYKYMRDYKIYNYENRLLPVEKYDAESLHSAYANWNSYPLIREPFFTNRVYENQLEKAFKFMNNERYREVNIILTAILEKYPDDQNAHFYLGISKYRQRSYSAALENFNSIIQDHPRVFKPEAEWYKSLCLLHSGDVQAAKEDLEKIVERNGFYHQRAKELLAQKIY